MLLELSPNFGWVIGTTVFSWFVHHGYMSSGVMKARKKYGVKYPALYADESKDDSGNAKAFNCVQRGQQNSLENQPIFLSLMILAGLQYPVTASVAGMIWIAGRITYFLGYSTGNPALRSRGAFGYLGLLTLLGANLKFAFDLLTSQ